MATVIEELEQQVKDNPVLLYMKGSPDSPQCGFSSKAEIRCNSCGSEAMNFKGDGTQQIEEIVKELFPNAISKRMDWDLSLIHI